MLTNGYLIVDYSLNISLPLGEDTMMFWSGLHKASSLQEQLHSNIKDAIAAQNNTFFPSFVGASLYSKARVSNGAVSNATAFLGILDTLNALYQHPMMQRLYKITKTFVVWLLKPGVDNWCFCQVSNLPQGQEICFGSYAEMDVLRLKTYRNEITNREGQVQLNAGNHPDESFQVSVWYRNRAMSRSWKLLTRLNRVFYRDVIRTTFHNNLYVVLHCKGEYHPVSEVGTVSTVSVAP